jgi:hypothetical protein
MNNQTQCDAKNESGTWEQMVQHVKWATLTSESKEKFEQHNDK